MTRFLIGLLGLFMSLPVLAGQKPPTTVPPGTPVTIMVSPAAPAPPSVSITLRERHGHVIPDRHGFTHTGAGYIDVAQPSPDTVVVTMTGVVVAGAHPHADSYAALDFDLDQCLEVSFDDPKVQKAKITIEGRIIGLLRSHPRWGACKKGCGTAEVTHAQAAVLVAGGAPVVALPQVPHTVACGENLSMNDHEGPVEATISAGKYTLHQTFGILAAHPWGLLPCQPASAEFAPDPALDPLWISYWEPFHGISKKDFGYQVIIKVAEDKGASEDKKEEKKAAQAPKPAAKSVIKPTGYNQFMPAGYSQR